MLSWNKKPLTAQGDFSENIAVARSKLCRLGMYLGNLGWYIFWQAGSGSSNRELSGRLGRAAHHDFEQRYELSRMVNAYEELMGT